MGAHASSCAQGFAAGISSVVWTNRSSSPVTTLRTHTRTERRRRRSDRGRVSFSTAGRRARSWSTSRSTYVAHESGRLDLVALRIAAEFAGPVPVGEVLIDVSIVRAARSAVLVRADLSSGGRRCLSAGIWLLTQPERPPDSPVPVTAVQPLVVPETSARWGGSSFPYGQALDWRVEAGSLTGAGAVPGLGPPANPACCRSGAVRPSTGRAGGRFRQRCVGRAGLEDVVVHECRSRRPPRPPAARRLGTGWMPRPSWARPAPVWPARPCRTSTASAARGPKPWWCVSCSHEDTHGDHED